MQTSPFGASDLKISTLGFGAWPIGGTTYGNISREEGLNALAQYFELGGRFIDTARAYRASENIIGEFLRSNQLRQETVLASKTKANTPEAMRLDLEVSLQELGTDYLDIYYLHQPPEQPDQRDLALETMAKFKEEGKIKVIGASISGPNVTEQTEDICRQYIDTGKIGAIQLIFSIFRQKLRSILSLAQNNGVGIVGRTALESGFLTGKYSPKSSFLEGDHRNRWTIEQREAILESVEHVQSLINDIPSPSHKMDLVSTAIRFAMDEPGIDSVILGAKNGRQSAQTFNIDQMPSLPESLRKRLIESFSGQDELCNLP